MFNKIICGLCGKEFTYQRGIPYAFELSLKGIRFIDAVCPDCDEEFVKESKSPDVNSKTTRGEQQ